MSNSTPTFAEVIMAAINSRLLDLHVSMPAVVEAYDKATNSVTVKPSLKRKYEGTSSAVDLPVIVKVPVAFPRGGKTSMTWPLEKGDSVMLVFSERSLDVWKARGGVVDPADPRKFHLTDAWAIPGGYDLAHASPEATSDRLRLQNGTTRIDLFDGGKFRFEKVGGDELLTLMIELVQLLIDAEVFTALGPQHFIANYLIQFNLLKTKFQNLKGT